MNLAFVVVFGLVLAFLLVSLAWRWASRGRALPCPTSLAWLLESSFLERWSGTQTTLDRLGLRPGEQILEVGPGPGRLLIPAARRLGTSGLAVGVDLQPGMLDRLTRRAQAAGLTNLRAILGDATRLPVEDSRFDLVFLCTVLGEVPDRRAALAECYRVLKPGGRLAITELFGDPHYQFRGKVEALAAEVGFRQPVSEGHWWFYTARFLKPGQTG